jgi:hypothetical protein
LIALPILVGIWGGAGGIMKPPVIPAAAPPLVGMIGGGRGTGMGTGTGTPKRSGSGAGTITAGTMGIPPAAAPTIATGGMGGAIIGCCSGRGTAADGYVAGKGAECAAGAATELLATLTAPITGIMGGGGALGPMAEAAAAATAAAAIFAAAVTPAVRETTSAFTLCTECMVP